MKNTLRDTVERIVREYARKKGFSLPEEFAVEITVSRDPTHGELTTPVAFRLTRWAQEKPLRIAEDLLSLFEKEVAKGKGEVAAPRGEVAGGGFINFFVPAVELAQVLVKIRSEDTKFGRSNFGKAKKVLIEFVSANPTGPLTIAHGRQAVVGDALARILGATGFQVTKEYYLNDAGRQIDLLAESLWVRYQELFGIEGTIPEEGYRGEYLKEIAERLKKAEKDSILKLERSKALQECKNFAVTDILGGIKEDLKALGVEFDSYTSEESLREKKLVEKTLELLRKKEVTYEKEGALWFRSTEFGDDKDRVLRKSTGEYTYLAPDIAYHWLKFDRKFEWLVNLWGPDHHGYVPRLKAACQALGHDSAQVKVLIVQLVTLYRQGQPVRMSTRAGEFVTLRELCDEVGPDATRFFFLLRRVESHLDFDLDLAKTKTEENPVYYLQYAHARISSILKFAHRKVESDANLNRLGAPEETELLKGLQEFPEILVQAAEVLDPYRIVEYLRDLATVFHKFYTLHRVVSEDEELTKARLLLVDGVRIVLRNSLAVLGVSHPETM